MKKIHCLFLIITVVPMLASAQSVWQTLSTGKDLSNWKQLGGKAKYSIQNNVIVGQAVPESPNSFLATKENYTDFILEFEVLDTELNSGVQIRSHSLPDFKAGRVHGYQVEIDPSQRSWTGGIYDEARRGWLYPLSINENARSAFKKGEWNKFHIEAIGNTINTWVNGVQCARLVDDMNAEGFIAFQVHAISKPELEGITVQWRDIRIVTKDLDAYRLVQDPEVSECSYLINTLTEWEKDHGWRLLWDGASTKGWRSAKEDKFPDSGWTIENGELNLHPGDGKESARPGDIITTKKFSDFEIDFEFWLTEGANSGFKYFIDPSLIKTKGSAIGCEFQLLDDKLHPDAKHGVAGNRTVGSLYDLIAATNLSVPDQSKIFKGVKEWNRAKIISRNGKVEHWLNNVKVVEYDRYSQIFKALVAYSKYKGYENFGSIPEGHLLLQDHGDEVKFRSIKIREL
ncbi:MAG TPA: DUF1080 domain-containing protein [Cyclobacteriaceae bacterium]|nr:DUF1080 domain-containing protein [Cyclobacteriaceae bacterium]